MSAGTPSELDKVWNQKLFAIPEERDQHGRRVFIFRCCVDDEYCRIV